MDEKAEGSSQRPSIDSMQLYRAALQRLGTAEDSDNSVGKPLRYVTRDAASSAHQPDSFRGSESSDCLSSFPLKFPSAKRIPGTRFIVDGFRFAGPWSVTYFLSHFHSDHYTGLTRLWNKGLVFCSEITARLVTESMKVPGRLVVPLKLGDTVRIDSCDVTFIDANHCPGAIQMLFHVPVGNGKYCKYVHTGDMRYSPAMKLEPALRDCVGADALFLDTTYCNPKFVFPSQIESVNYVAETIYQLMQGEADAAEVSSTLQEKGETTPSKIEALDCAVECEASLSMNVDTAGNRGSEILSEEKTDFREEAGLDSYGNIKASQGFSDHNTCSGNYEGTRQEPAFPLEGTSDWAHSRSFSLQREGKRSILFLISTYVIGKEKILLAVAKRCNCLIYVNETKLCILKCLGLNDIGVFTTNPLHTNVHVTGWKFLGETWPFFRPNFQNLEKLLQGTGYKRIAGFIPTGWTYEVKKKAFSVRRKGPFELYLVPYSEHSNYDELREYVAFVRPKEIIPTVGLEGGEMDGKAVSSMRKHFRNLIDETASKKKFLKGFKHKIVGEVDNVLNCRTSEGKEPAPADIKFDDSSKTNAACAFATGLLGSTSSGNFTLDPESMSAVPRKRRRDSRNMEDIAMEKKASIVGTKNASGHVAQTEMQSLVFKECQSLSMESPDDYFEMMAVEEKLSSTFLSSYQQAYCAGMTQQRVADDLLLAKDARQQMNALPPCVSLEQLRTLVTQAKGDTNTVVSNYEHEGKFWRESRQGMQPCDINLVNVDKISDTNLEFVDKSSEGPLTGESFESEVDKHGVMDIGEGKPMEVEFGSQKSSSSNPSHHLVSSSCSIASLISHGPLPVTVNKQKRKISRAPSSKIGKDLQSSILTFFKKENTKSPSLILERGILDCGKVEEAVPNNSRKSKNKDHSTENVCKDRQMHVCKLKEEDKGFTVVDDSKSCKFYTPEKLSQLLGVLDGCLSEVDGIALLEKGGGDVNEALNLYYIDGRVSSVANECAKEVAAESSIAKDNTEEKVLQVLEGIHDGTQRELEYAHVMSTSNVGSAQIRNINVHLKRPKQVLSLEMNAGSVALPLGKYNPIEHAFWSTGQPAPYLHLARAFDLVEQESGRLKVTEMLCNMFRSLLALSPEDVLPAVYLSINRIAPEHENVDLNVGGSIVLAAIVQATGTPQSKLRDMYKTMGDLGDVAQACSQKQSMLTVPPPLYINQVFSTLHQISKEIGSGSSSRKKGLILSLLRACREKETKYIIRTLVQNLRIGAMTRTILPALAQAVALHSLENPDQIQEKTEGLKAQLQNASVAVVEAYNFMPNLNLLVPTLIQDGVEAVLNGVVVSPGSPMKPMLAKITNGISEVLKHFHGRAYTCEYKYDGQRAQVHKKSDGLIKIFSRNCEDTTLRFPDVTEIICTAMRPNIQDFILDAEIVAVDRENNRLLAFQHLSTRARGSRDGNSMKTQNVKVDVCIFAFDLMYADGILLVKMPLQERRKRMHELFPRCIPGYFGYASEISVESSEALLDSANTLSRVEEFFKEAIASSCEGLMVKALEKDSEYVASKRSDSWLKVYLPLQFKAFVAYGVGIRCV